jgi:MoxR-like ATPase
MTEATEAGDFFGSVPDARDGLARAGYLADDATATAVFLADRLGMPLLVEGPAGVGKTELAKAVATAVGGALVRLQCYEGLDEARALYEWNYKKQLLRIQAGQTGSGEPGWDAVQDDIFSEEFLLARPLLAAIRRTEPTVLLIDETDKADVEMEGLLLEVLSDFQVTVPELGTIVAAQRPFVVLTSNATRELSEALKRRCLFLHMDYPDAAREKQIVLARVPGVGQRLAEQVVGAVRALRAMELRKPPSIAETIDWARTMLALGLDSLDPEAMAVTLGVVLKHEADQARAAQRLQLSRPT